MTKLSKQSWNFLGDSLLGAKIAGRFTIKSYLGRGASGSVYLAEQEGTGREVALKILNPDRRDPRAAERFAHEARIAGRLSHPNTITIYDSGRDKDIQFIAMEYLHGRSLARELMGGPLSPARVIRITEQILASLEDAHNHGIIHRDLKPENVFLVQRGAEEVVKVLDFGIAKAHLSDPGLTTTGIIYGTPLYMSPEQAKGEELDGRSDLYAVGVMMYEMLCGVRPFGGRTPVEVATNHLVQPVPSLYAHRPELSAYPRLVKVVERALAKERKNRFPDARSMAEALRASDLAEPHKAKPLPFIALGASFLLFGLAFLFRLNNTRSAELEITSEAPAAQILVDGVEVGGAPARLRGLSPGSTAIVELRAPGGHMRTAVTLEPGVNLISFPLPKAPRSAPTSPEVTP